MSVCDSYCRDCDYHGYGDGWTILCLYLFREGKIRPCPAGNGCTVKKVKKKSRGDKRG